MKKSARSECSSRDAAGHLEPQLRDYSALGAATIAVAGAVGVTAVASATPQDITDPSVVFNIPFNGGDTLQFVAGPFHGSFSAARNHASVSGSISWGAFIQAAGTDGDQLLHLTGNRQIAALAPGAALTGDFQTGFGGLGSATVNNFGNHAVHHTNILSGFFEVAGVSAAATNYIGFKAFENSNTYYGWLRVKVQNGADGLPSQISLVAKDGEPTVFGAFGLASDNVLAGQSFGTAIPEPANVAGGLALLALGAAGVRELRRRRRESAEKSAPPA